MVGLSTPVRRVLLVGPCVSEWAFSDGERRFVHLANGGVVEFRDGVVGA